MLEVVRRVGVGVEPGRDQNVELRDLIGNPFDTRQESAEPVDGGVDDRVDPSRRKRMQALYRIGDPSLLVSQSLFQFA